MAKTRSVSGSVHRTHFHYAQYAVDTTQDTAPYYFRFPVYLNLYSELHNSFRH